eukprot:6335670-Prymnesium_polylepis.2
MPAVPPCRVASARGPSAAWPLPVGPQDVEALEGQLEQLWYDMQEAIADNTAFRRVQHNKAGRLANQLAREKVAHGVLKAAVAEGDRTYGVMLQLATDNRATIHEQKEYIASLEGQVWRPHTPPPHCCPTHVVPSRRRTHLAHIYRALSGRAGSRHRPLPATRWTRAAVVEPRVRQEDGRVARDREARARR